MGLFGVWGRFLFLYGVVDGGVCTGGYVFGPVFSRRLGRSLGVNNIPYKT